MPLDSTRASTDVRVVAREYHDASVGLRDAEARRKKATAAAVKLGVLPDHERFPLPVGTAEVVYADDGLVISVTVVAPITGWDHAGFVADLLKAGVKPALIKRLDKKHRTETRPAHKFVSSLVST
jgi:hypothetical protein